MNITVLLGGTSSERNVSLASGIRIIDALRARNHHVTPLDPATGVLTEDDLTAIRTRVVGIEPPSLEALQGLSQAALRTDLLTLPEIQHADVVFLGLHGGYGEDGTLQAMLNMAGVKYTGTGHLGSAIAMDKDVSKTLMRAAGVQTADWIMAPPAGEIATDEIIATLGLPLIVKPSKQGSTVGLTVVKNVAQLQPAVRNAFLYDDEVMIEQFIAGRELTVSVLGGEALPVGEIFAKHEIYDYECKYTTGMASETFPANLSQNVTKTLQEQAVLAFKALKLGGSARIDFRMDAEENCYCLEANTLPGMTPLSLVPQAAAAAGIGFEELCERIVRLAVG